MTPEALARLHARGFHDHRAWSAAEFADLLAQPHVFLAALPHAFALGRAVAGEAELLTITTDPDQRRRGLARRCLSEFEAAARSRDANRAFLEVSEENEPACALYRTVGYSVIATRRGYYQTADGRKCDALIMEKPLTA